MNVTLRAISALCLLFSAAQAATETAAAKKIVRTQAEIEAAARLQVFLDRANFGPGKIDGYYGSFTRKALDLYQKSRTEAAPAPTPAPVAQTAPDTSHHRAQGGSPLPRDAQSGSQPKPKPKPLMEPPPDVTGLDLASIGPVFIQYTVTAADLAGVGEVPATVAGQAKVKWLPYQSADEAIAEKFHCDVDFLAELNPGKTKNLQAGDRLTVPNVEPFDVATVKDIKPGGDIAANEVEEAGEEKEAANKTAKDAEKPSAAAMPATSVYVDTQTNMLEVHEGEKLIAAYPVTIGSEHTQSPIGEWKIRGVAKLPNFRYDLKLLNEGKRSADSHLLPPGPNNPVGVIWIALNKKGNGLHGTNDPDSIGRSASHGCVRLANWDVVRLAGKVKYGVPVTIR